MHQEYCDEENESSCIYYREPKSHFQGLPDLVDIDRFDLPLVKPCVELKGIED